jgi:hypothetical protein
MPSDPVSNTTDLVAELRELATACWAAGNDDDLRVVNAAADKIELLRDRVAELERLVDDMQATMAIAHVNE